MNDFVSKPIEQAMLFGVLAAWVAPRTAAGVEPPRGAALAETESDYPGFDFAAGLRRLEGNRVLLLRLMADFARDYADAAERIRHAAEASDWESARRLAHRVRGAAGNLSASELFAVAGRVEHAAAKCDIGATRDALDAFDIALVLPIRTGAAVRAGNEMDEREVELGNAASADVTEDIIQRAKAILDVLTALLERHDPAAEALLAELRRLLRDTKFDGPLVIAANGLASYDFRAPAEVLRKLREELDLVVAPS
jgi:HPt (histidine-containing phosphotransfer) domain-containing protein